MHSCGRRGDATGGPPPHRHNREDETFIVLEGALEFRANGRAVPASAGTVIHVPKGTVHSYATWAGLIGLVWVAARGYYAVSYFRDPETRGPGFVIALASAAILLLGAIVGILIRLV